MIQCSKETILLGSKYYTIICTDYERGGYVCEVTSTWEDIKHRSSFSIEPAPGRILERNLEADEMVIGTQGLADQFSHEHLIVFDTSCVYDNGRGLPRMISALEKYVAIHSDKRFLFTKLLCGMAGFTIEQVAPYFGRLLWYDNVRLPAEFIDELANNPSSFRRCNVRLTQAQIDALYQWRNRRKLIRIKEQYGDIFSVLSKDRAGEVSRMICAADNGEYMSIEYINTIRNVIQDCFSDLRKAGFLLSEADKITDCGKELSYIREVPDHIRSFTFALIGIVNGGSHPTYYRRVIGQGDYRHLLKSMTYMLISIMEWWSLGFPMLDIEDQKRPKKSDNVVQK